MTRVALFVAGLAGAFLAAFAIGRGLDIDERTVAEAADHATMSAAPSAPAGVALEQDGYRLEQERAELVAGTAAPYVFRIVGPRGHVLRDYDVEHERRLHLIVVGRAPSAQFLHLHPSQRADGAWTVPLELPVNGSYRVFADFTTEGTRRTLGIDLAGSGGPARAPAGKSRYAVAVSRDGDRLSFDVKGEEVQLQRYLGAAGHLVVLRRGDLAYVHAHAGEDELAFDVPFPTPGLYDLYLQFKAGGEVQTVSKEVRE